MSNIIKAEESFRNLTGLRKPASSQLNTFNIFLDLENNEYFMNIFKSYLVEREILENYNYYLLHEVDDTDWLDLISEMYYDTPSLWWIICISNNIINPFEGVVPGDLLKIIRRNFIPKILKDIVRIGKV